MKEKGLLQKGDLIVSVSVKNPKNAKQPKRAKLEIPSSVPPDSFQPKCTCRIGLFQKNKVCRNLTVTLFPPVSKILELKKIIPAHFKDQQFAWLQNSFKEKSFIAEHQQVVYDHIERRILFLFLFLCALIAFLTYIDINFVPAVV